MSDNEAVEPSENPPAFPGEEVDAAGDVWKHLLVEPNKRITPGTDDFRGWLRERPYGSQV